MFIPDEYTWQASRQVAEQFQLRVIGCNWHVTIEPDHMLGVTTDDWTIRVRENLEYTGACKLTIDDLKMIRQRIEYGARR